MLRNTKTFTRTTIRFSAVTVLIAILSGLFALYLSHVSMWDNGKMSMLVWGILLSIVFMILVPVFLLAAIFNALTVFIEPNKIYKIVCGLLSLIFISACVFLLKLLL